MNKKTVFIVLVLVLIGLVSLAIALISYFGLGESQVKESTSNEVVLPIEKAPSSLDKNNKIQFEDTYFLEIEEMKVIEQVDSFFRPYVDVLSDDDFLYFSSLEKIYRSAKDGTQITTIFSREPSGVEMKITKVDNEWIYFEITSEDGISVNRIKKDGSGFEHLEQKGETDGEE